MRLRETDTEWFGLLDSHLLAIEGVLLTLLVNTTPIEWSTPVGDTTLGALLVAYVTARESCGE